MEVIKPTQEKILRLAFLGVGWIGKNRMDSLITSGLVSPAIIADTNTSLLREAHELYPGAEITDNFHPDPDLDGVVIATPNSLHASQSTEALKMGIPVFCQKPLSRTAAETKYVVKTAKENNTLLGVDFSYRYTAAFQKLFEVVRSGEIGEVFTAELIFHNAYGPIKQWFFNMDLSGGGCLIDLGIHLIDLLMYTLDFPDVVNAEGSLYTKGSRIKNKDITEDYASARFLLDNDVSVKLDCSWNISIGQDAVIEAVLYGTKGTIALRNVAGSFFDFITEIYRGTKRDVLVSPPDDWAGRAAVEWAKRLLNDRTFDTSAENFIKTAKVIDLIYNRYQEQY